MKAIRVQVKLFGAFRDFKGGGELGLEIPRGRPSQSSSSLSFRKCSYNNRSFRGWGSFLARHWETRPKSCRIPPSWMFPLRWPFFLRCVVAEMEFMEKNELTWIGVSPTRLSTENCLDFLGVAGHGAEVCFFGVIRDENRGRRVVAVSYDVFEPLALTAFRGICEKAREKWGKGLRVFLMHRKGTLEVGEVAVAIGVSSPHRDEAYQASRYIIEEVKHQAPIWKKEHYERGESEWVQGHSLCGK